jgi:hypothetical protein
MKSWVAAPSLFCAGSSVDHAPEYPLLSRTVIAPPPFGAVVAMGLLEGPVELVPLDEPPLLHAAAAVTTSATAPARQAVRIDFCRNLTAFTYS